MKQPFHTTTKNFTLNKISKKETVISMNQMLSIISKL